MSNSSEGSQSLRWIVISVMVFFIGVMTVVAVTAFRRQSGSTGLDAAQMQQTRYHAVER